MVIYIIFIFIIDFLSAIVSRKKKKKTIESSAIESKPTLLLKKETKSVRNVSNKYLYLKKRLFPFIYFEGENLHFQRYSGS